jgi:hypothetical protein
VGEEGAEVGEADRQEILQGAAGAVEGAGEAGVRHLRIQELEEEVDQPGVAQRHLLWTQFSRRVAAALSCSRWATDHHLECRLD